MSYDHAVLSVFLQVDVAAFDKTGTLTEDGLDLKNVVPVNSSKFGVSLTPEDVKYLDKNSPLLRCMATCHSLTIIEGNVTGDPLDLKMFEATGFELVEPTVLEVLQFDELSRFTSFYSKLFQCLLFHVRLSSLPCSAFSIEPFQIQ